jgi:cystathionine beta-lyase/cystathionine gamma-synthase
VFEGHEGGYDDVRYTRCNNNPTQLSLGAQLAALEGSEAALPVASGMAAVTTTLLYHLKPGAHMLIVRGPYGGTNELASQFFPKWGVESSFVGADSGPDEWAMLLRPGKTCLFYAEAISNPLCKARRGAALGRGPGAGGW